VLGVAGANQFTLDTSQLAGSQFNDVFYEAEEGGEFRQIQYEITQSAVNQDIELHSITAVVTPGAVSTES